MKPTMKWFIFAIAAMGLIRFVLSISGVPDNVVKYFSMIVIIMAGTLYFAVTCTTHKERLKAAYLLILPYMTIEVLALAYTWATGQQTIFHSADYSLGFPIAWHTVGHLVGGLTWEPLSVFLLMELVWYIYLAGRSLLKPKPKPRPTSA
jgi:hypothetical protein